MASERDLAQGKIYTIRPISECFDLGIDATIIPHIITSTLDDGGDYVPISPTRKERYPIQLRLRNYPDRNSEQILIISQLEKYSYLKIDECYEVPLQMLLKHRDDYGNHYMILRKRRGGLAQLQDHIRKRDLAREAENRPLPSVEEELGLLALDS
ncbi:hypothetical protein N7517_001413 [Penicillium concentricum]|uniref:Uncharacterized protein n=1 Tax=Penicillium concentricum TaxID=293559 RepID=A0A9W9VIT9_9EURO|nr:uncharacterized protein N7517_001413 [Penicillium concentricum]KAJ5383502.1 hypothetical protein N7517_001413 [Penicillium concentricum]